MEEIDRRAARDNILRETTRQVKKESRILERTWSSLIREINTGARDMRLMGVKWNNMNETRSKRG